MKVLVILFSILWINNPIQSYKRKDTLVIRFFEKEVYYSMTSKEIIGSREFDNPEKFDLRKFYKISDLFIHGGGGVVLKDERGIDRIDNSFDHKLQLSSNIFSYNDTIFRFGGYGFFDNRSFMTFYDERINEWESYNYNGDIHPKGTHGSEHLQLKDKFIVFGGHLVDPKKRSQSIEYNGVQEFSFRSKEWRSVGETINRYFDKKNTIKTEFGFIYFGSLDNQTEIVNFNENEVVVLADNPLHRKIQSSIFTPQIFRDTIFFSNDDISEISFISLNDFIGKYRIESRPFLVPNPSENNFPHSMLIDFSILLFFPIMILIFRHFLTRKVFVLKDGRIYYLFRELGLSEFEKDFLKIFFSKSKSGLVRVENSEVLKLFTVDLDIGTITRRKNEKVNLLNEKIKFILKTPKNLVVSKKSSSDRRNIYYELDLNFFYFL